MASVLSKFDLREQNGEPLVKDLRLAEALGFERPRSIRQTIERNLKEIETLGTSPRRVAVITVGNGAKMEVIEYWLNEPQAILVCMFARTANAAEVRKQVIEVFMAWRQNKLPVKVKQKKRNKEIVRRVIRKRDDLSFTIRDENGHMVNWVMPSSFQQAEQHYRIGRMWFDEIVELAKHDSAEAYDALRFSGKDVTKYINLAHAEAFYDAMAHYALLGILSKVHGYNLPVSIPEERIL